MNNIQRIFLFTVFGLIALSAFAQPCSREELQKRPGVWKEGIKGSTNNVTAANLVKEKEVVQSIFAMIKEGYSPVGCEVTHTGVYGYNAAYGKNWVADPYKFRAYFLRYHCDPNDKQKSYVDISTGTILSISVNHFTYANEVIYAADLPDDHKEGYIMVRELPEYKNGYYYWESKTEYDPRSNYNSKDKKYYWLIAYNNKLPYVHVTQKEYLLKTLASFKSEVQEINENEKRDKAKNAGFSEDDKKRYDQQRDYYGPAIQNIEGMLKNKSEAELASPAIIYHVNDMQPFREFVPMGTSGSDILIKPNPDYYDKKLPSHAPQLFSIWLSIDHGDPVNEHVYEHVSKAIDIKKFKAMLGETYVPETKATMAPKVSNPVSNIPESASAKATTIEKKPSASAVAAQNTAGNDNMDNNLLPVFDLDSNQYNVIKIGNQYWFKENLRTTQYNDTTLIATGLSDSEWKQTTKGAYAVFENKPTHESTYGKLYNGYAVVTGKLCPKGWRIPTDNDWKELESVLGVSSAELDRTGERGNIGDKLKSKTLWKPSEFSNTNSSNFNIVPAGSRKDNGEYISLGQYGNFWTSTVYDDRWGLFLWNRHWHYNTHAAGRIYTPATNGYSCKCIKYNKFVK